MGMDVSHRQSSEHRRFRSMRRRRVGGVDAVVAEGMRQRLFGLALIPRESAPAGLLIPRCGSVHSFGMRFPIEVRFLDGAGAELRRTRLEPRSLAAEPGAASVLEIPLDQPPTNGPGGRK